MSLAVAAAPAAWGQHAGRAAPEGDAPPPAAADSACPPEHAAMGHCTPRRPAASPPADPHAGHAAPVDHSSHGQTAAASPGLVGEPPPEALQGPEHAADTVWDPARMARARADDLLAEHGGYSGYLVLLDRLEASFGDDAVGYAWEGEAWWGGDYNRLWLKSEGEAEPGEALEAAELQALYSRAVDPWFNLQAGVRYDVRPEPERAHLVVGLQGLAPYWFEVDAAAFLSDEGELTARLEAEQDFRITNRLFLQPRLEVDVSAGDIPEVGIGSGLSKVEAGLRLRYEIKREFAPYVGVQYESRIGETADLARAAGEDASGWTARAGLRSWF